VTERAGLAKRSLTIAGHRTSLALEPEFWAALEAIATREGTTLPRLIGAIDGARAGGNLASALRVHVLKAAQAARAG
jgi:predicted DNA-binding ribbon-helix-helix protein